MQNLRFWGTENPRVTHEEPLHPLKVTVWYAVFAGGVNGPFFFEDVAGQTVTVNGERYRAMINEFFLPQLDELGLANMWFQQDGATAHTARATTDMLKDAFSGRLISRFGDMHWPRRSPELKDNIRQECEDLSPEVLAKVMENAIKRAQMTINCGGGHLHDIIFST